MSSRRDGKPREVEADVVVTVSRGCCCGTAATHPDFDHHSQVGQLRRALASSTRAGAGSRSLVTP